MHYGFSNWPRKRPRNENHDQTQNPERPTCFAASASSFARAACLSSACRSAAAASTTSRASSGCRPVDASCCARLARYSAAAASAAAFEAASAEAVHVATGGQGKCIFGRARDLTRGNPF